MISCFQLAESIAMTAALQRMRATPEQYLAAERAASYKSEYIGGYILAMSGASRAHNVLSLRIGGLLDAQLVDSPCEVYSGDMRVRVSVTGDYTYPDVVVACGDIEFEDVELDTLLTPIVIIEVLSPSTEAYDRSGKFESYRQIDSLREYVMVAQDRIHIEQYVRREAGWLLTVHSDPEGSLYLPAIDCTLSLKEVYRKVRFPSQPPPQR
jgi:Uma2 family endonuclease